ncbi:hypothetical protein QHF85_21240 [Polyangium sp. 6x1]|nr:hypothetical protein [Polyangium sp. 6x1]
MTFSDVMMYSIEPLIPSAISAEPDGYSAGSPIFAPLEASGAEALICVSLGTAARYCASSA